MKNVWRRALWVAPIAALIGCSDGSNKVLSRVTTATTCASGKGVTIATGIDKNGNGMLDDDEVTQTSDLCDGASTPGPQGTSGHSNLVKTTDLAPGDVNCVYGGTKVEQGVDDGSGGGTADDGTLQAGEIKSTKYVCNGGLPLYPGSTTPPAGPEGSSRIDVFGGDGTTGNGGGAGKVEADIDSGTLGGHVKIFATGVADASFTPPTVTFDGGSVVMTVSADTLLKSYADQPSGIASTDPYFLVNYDSTIYKNVSGVATAVTGVDVTAGTLTFQLNWVGSYTNIQVTHDFRNAGKLKTDLQADAKSASSLTINCGSYLGLQGSSIDLSGLAATGSTGGAGAELDLYASKNIINQGTVTTTGGDGDTGGTGGEIYFQPSVGGIYNTGALSSSGGAGAVNNGGDAGPIYLGDWYQGYGPVFSSGAVTANGGAGATSGGSGGYIMFYSYFGGVKSAAPVTHKGGTCSATDCTGGSGGAMDIYSYSGPTVLSGGFDAQGADGKGTGDGGSGGTLSIESDENSSCGGNVEQPTGSIEISGNILLNGGKGTTGGSGGDFDVKMYPYYQPQGQEIILYGYTDIHAKGGDSMSGSGGDGNGFYLYNNYAAPGDSSYYYGPGGAIINYANFDGRGGSGASAGSPAEVYFDTQLSYYFNDKFEFVENHGTLDVTGGSSTGDNNNASNGGYLELKGASGVTNSGTLKGSGGSATGANANGGGGNQFYLTSDWSPVSNTGALELNGGGATGTGSTGGGAGSLYISGVPASNTGALGLSGGAGVLNGGSGGYCEIFSTASASTNTGAISIGGGAATNAGSKGQILMDGADITP